MRSAKFVIAAVAGLGIAVSASAEEKAEKPKSDLVCKRTMETGSLVAKRKECRTREQWDLIAQMARQSGQYEIDRQMSRPGGQ